MFSASCFTQMGMVSLGAVMNRQWMHICKAGYHGDGLMPVNGVCGKLCLQVPRLHSESPRAAGYPAAELNLHADSFS